jgi:soluble lytic murein transglycosylase-like protein
VTRWLREHNFDAIIDREAANRGVDPDLVRGLIGHESQFNARAIGDDGSSFGLMQVQQATAREVGVTGDLLDPGNNIRAGVAYLAQQIARTGSIPAGLSAYNGGYRPAQGFGAPLPTGRFYNQAYVDTVMNNWAYFANSRAGTWQQLATKPAKQDLGTAGVDLPASGNLSGQIALAVAVLAAVVAGLWALLHH